MSKYDFWPSLIGLLLFFQTLEVGAQYIIHEGDEKGDPKSSSIIIPYAFSTETLGFGVGVGVSYGPKGVSYYYSTAFATDNGSSYFMLGGNNLRIPWTERFYVRPWVSVGHYTHMRIFVDGNPNFPDERAGSNESSKDNYREVDANDVLVDFEFRYILPWGHYRDSSVHTYITQNGLLKENPSGAESWNPFKSGQSSVLLRPYYRKQYTDLEGKETLFFQLGYRHDNRDFVPNPHRGYLLKTSISHDPDWLDQSRKWTSLEGELDGFIPMWENTRWTRQQTLALSAWTAYSPSYDEDSLSEENGRPPYFVGPTLGGFWRMRGYPAYRFHDKASIYYSAEYRIMPEWQPFGQIDLLKPLDIRWWQIVGLVEVGRVAPEWDLGMLHSDMKYDFGVGLRGMFQSTVGRVDFVVSDEGFSFTFMLGQSF